MAEPVKGTPEWIKAEQAKVGKPWGAGKSCLGCFGLVVVVALIFGGCTALSGSSGSHSSSDNKYESIAQCEARIEKLLKSPSTADFDSNASGSGSGPWKVTGTVDAQNSFGATVRASYGCTVTMTEDMATTKVDYFEE